MSAIEIRNVKKRYKDLQALKGVSLTVEEGEFFGLLGPNGAGKTTLISILAGLARADEGSIAVRGHDVVSDFRDARRALGVVPQELVFDPFFTTIEVLDIQAGLYGVPKAERRSAKGSFNPLGLRSAAKNCVILSSLSARLTATVTGAVGTSSPCPTGL